VGSLVALEGRFDEGRELLEQARAIFSEHGNKMALALLGFSTGPLELHAGDPVAAEREFRASLNLVQQIGHRGGVPNLAAALADALLEQGRIDDAEQYVDVAREGAQTGDVSGGAVWRMAAARLLARRGSTDEAVSLALESVTMLAATEELLGRPELLVRQAEVLELAGRDADAAAALREAIELWELKGAVAEVRRTQERLAALEAG
jgi:tetratricopeptide (TPR) repeat protein